MHRRLAPLVGILIVLSITAPMGARAATPTEPVPRIVATFPPGDVFGSFAESLAAAPDGSLYATVTIWHDATSNTGRLYRISVDGRMRQVGPDLDVGILSGLAFGQDGGIYAGAIAFAPTDEPAGVLRYGPDGKVSRVVTLPEGAFPNGLAFHGGALYISDSWNGAIWKTVPRRGHSETLDTPWLVDPTLGVVTEGGWAGVNGIAFLGNTLYAVNADAGSVVRIPVNRDGSAGAPALFVQPQAGLVGADGIAFDADGGLWIAVNHGDEFAGGALAVAGRDGRVRMVADDPGWLDYPVQPAFGVGATAQTLYVLNGSLNPGTPNLIALKAGVRGVALGK